MGHTFEEGHRTEEMQSASPSNVRTHKHKLPKGKER
uniref:Uncharacterized protein n=1 Tax=Anguilla anguilla TaxID=7936 RepID=A0A0E9SQN3_ANGAN